MGVGNKLVLELKSTEFLGKEFWRGSFNINPETNGQPLVGALATTAPAKAILYTTLPKKKNVNSPLIQFGQK